MIGARFPAKCHFAHMWRGKSLEFTSNIFGAAASWGGGLVSAGKAAWFV